MEMDRTNGRLFPLCEELKTKSYLTVLFHFRSGSSFKGYHDNKHRNNILFASMVAVNGILHKIGGLNSADHMIWNEQEMH